MHLLIMVLMCHYTLHMKCNALTYYGVNAPLAPVIALPMYLYRMPDVCMLYVCMYVCQWL
jgi:hypothetical protein